MSLNHVSAKAGQNPVEPLSVGEGIKFAEQIRTIDLIKM
jgi:hypothetical protein